MIENSPMDERGIEPPETGEEAAGEAGGGATSRPALRSLIRWGLILAAVVALVFLGRELGGTIEGFKGFVAEFGVWGPVVFILGYAVGVVAFAPGAALTLAGGAIFGIGPGFVYVFIAAVLGSSAAFLVSRYLTRARIEKRLEGDERFAAIDRAVGAQGRKIVFLLRLSPVFPFNLLNYALGLTRVSFADYMIASLGMIPGTFLYVYAGAAGGAVLSGGANYAVLGLGLAATVAVTVIVTRIARRALQEATDA